MILHAPLALLAALFLMALAVASPVDGFQPHVPELAEFALLEQGADAR